MEAANVHLRTRAYVSLLLIVSAFAIVIALVTLAFLGAVSGLHYLVWEELPDALGIDDPFSWYALAVTALGGLAVGVLLTLLPGHGGPGPAEGHGIGMEQVPVSHAAGMVFVSIVSLTAGASLGPEAALLAAALALGSILTARLHRSELEKVLGMSGVGSLLAGLFGSPLAPSFLVLEVTPVTGHSLYVFLLPVLVASAIGLLVFDAILNGPLLELALPAYGGVELAHLFEALLVAGVAAVVGLLVIATHRAVRRSLRPLADRVIVRGTVGGIAIGVIALVAGEETLFSGEHELEVLLAAPAAYGAGKLLLILVGKVLAFAISLESGFRGGRIFPVLFIGSTVGFIASDLVEDIPLAVSVGCAMAGAAVAIMRLPVFVALVVAFFAAPAALPLIVLACVVGYVVTFDRPELGVEPVEDDEPSDIVSDVNDSRGYA